MPLQGFAKWNWKRKEMEIGLPVEETNWERQRIQQDLAKTYQRLKNPLTAKSWKKQSIIK